MNFRAAFLSALLLLFFLSPTFSQSEAVTTLLQQGSFGPDAERAILALFDEADAAGVPESLLLPRLQEGISKNVPANRIVRALENDLATLLAARSVLEQVRGGGRILSDGARWARAANFLAAGRTEEELRVIVDACASEPESFRQATVLYISLLEWGVTDNAVVELVEAAVDSRLEPREFSGIPELFALARRERVRPDRTVERILSALPRVDSLPELRSMVIR